MVCPLIPLGGIHGPDPFQVLAHRNGASITKVMESFVQSRERTVGGGSYLGLAAGLPLQY